MRSVLGFLALLFLLSGAVHAQAPAAPKNLVVNGAFKSSFARPNLWYGVDANGHLAGNRRTVPALSPSGSVMETAVPISVSISDMNGDGRPDIVTADTGGYLRIYFNEGSATEPKFSKAELASVFLARPDSGAPAYSRMAPRIFVTDPAGSKDLLIGNYIGEILYLKNAGGPSAPKFTQPRDLSSLAVPTTNEATRRWGNLFAPVMWDWDGDRKADLLIGEGSYSANNIHLAVNEGSSVAPKSSEGSRHVIAFGDGRLQVVPAVADYNGDRKPDLLVAARDGRVSVHLHPPGNWEPGMELPFASYVPLDGSANKDLAFSGACTIAVGDLNGDKKFDLVAGQANGRIAAAYNVGTASEPKFSKPADLTGSDKAPAFRLPTGWATDIGDDRGNMLAYVTVVDAKNDPNAAPPEGETCVKFGYLPNLNKIMPAPYISLSGLGNFDPRKTTAKKGSGSVLGDAPSNYCMMRQDLRARLEVGKTYDLSFKVKGAKVSDAVVNMLYSATAKLGDEKITRGERGAVTVQRNEVQETVREVRGFAPGANWTTVDLSVKVNFRNRDLNEKAKKNVNGVVEIVFALAPGAGELYVDDVKFVEKPQ